MGKLLKFKLKFLAKLILKKYHPKIIGVTGTIGKTSTKEAVYAVLNSKFNVRTNIKNYNNEFGLPLTIIGSKSPGRNIFGWAFVFLKAVLMLVFKNKNYPQILILEMGIDHPGDMDYLLKIIKPYIGVFTAIGPTHLEHFKNLNELIKEKSKLIQNVEEGGWSILNIDDERVSKVSKKIKSQFLTYGFNKQADIQADYVRFSYKEDKEDANSLQGLSFKVNYQGATVPVLLPYSLGIGQIYASLVAIAIGSIYGMNLIDITQALKKFKPAKGRMNLIKGIKYSIIIDDTYNSAPGSVLAALEVLNKIPLDKQYNRYAILGDMLELGSMSVSSHEEVGRKVAELKIDYLIVIGERARDIARVAEKSGMDKDHIFNFDNSDDAKKFIEDRIAKGDLILIKGSQGMRMEKITKEIMAEPSKAGKLLIRQGREWLS